MMTIDDGSTQAMVAPMPDLPRCSIAGASPETRRMADLPAKVRVALQAAMGGRIAEAGAPFNGSDIVPPDSPPQVRFLRAYHIRDRWLVWIERGGIAHSFRVLAFQDGRAGIAPVAVPPGGAKNVCAASQAIAAN